MQLYGHPFSSYTQKALIALYENATPFTYRKFGQDDPQAFEELTALWPMKRFPLLRDGERTIIEATTIIEHLHVAHRGRVPLIPDDPAAAVEVRMMDRIFDCYVMTPMQMLVADVRRPEGDRDPFGVAEAHGVLENAYAWLEKTLASRPWAAGDAFSLADCAAAPSLFYADWLHPIGEAHATLRAYRGRLLARPSFARAIDEARPYRRFFPPGAPDRD